MSGLKMRFVFVLISFCFFAFSEGCQCTNEGEYTCTGIVSAQEIAQPCLSMKHAVFVTNSDSICGFCENSDRYSGIPVKIVTNKCGCLYKCCDHFTGCGCEQGLLSFDNYLLMVGGGGGGGLSRRVKCSLSRVGGGLEPEFVARQALC